MQEDFPGAGDFLGQFWYTPSTAQLRVYSRGSGPENIWLPVGFGALQQQNLRVGFTYDATTSQVVTVTTYGVNAGISAGDVIPDPTEALVGIYGVCVVPGNAITVLDLSGTTHTAGDWILCLGETQGWVHVDTNTNSGGGGGGAAILNDLLDVTIGGNAFTLDGPVQAIALEDGHILQYRADLGQWVNRPGGGSVAIGVDPPAGADPGDMWFDPESGQLFIWYTDDDSSQWVPASPSTGGGGGPTGDTLAGLDDVDFTADCPADNGVFLQYNCTANTWQKTDTIDGGSF